LGGLAYWQGDYATATSRYREALAIFRDLGDRIAVGETLFALSTSATWSGDSAMGEDLAGEALTIFEDADAREQVGMVRMAQGFARWMQNDLRAARPLWEASIEIAREVGDRVEAAHKTLALAAITFAEGHADAAIEQAVDAMEELFRKHNVALTVMAIDFVAAMTVNEQPRLAARLSGAATQLRGTMGGGMRPEACGLPSVSEVATQSIGAKDFRLEFDQGRKLDLFKAIELVRTLSPSRPTHAEPNQSHRDHS
jgi:tetratricopeptide (TPR) repeat protein